MSNMFEVATRKKLRFPHNGQIGVEYLWDLSLTNLNVVYQTLKAEAKDSVEDSLLEDSKSDKNKELDLKIEIVKYIFDTKKSEKDAVAEAKLTKENNQKIQEIIAEKENEALKGKSVDELKAMIK